MECKHNENGLLEETQFNIDDFFFLKLNSTEKLEDNIFFKELSSLIEEIN